MRSLLLWCSTFYCHPKFYHSFPFTTNIKFFGQISLHSSHSWTSIAVPYQSEVSHSCCSATSPIAWSQPPSSSTASSSFAPTPSSTQLYLFPFASTSSASPALWPVTISWAAVIAAWRKCWCSLFDLVCSFVSVLVISSSSGLWFGLLEVSVGMVDVLENLEVWLEW